jgi:hypothetical protein
VTPLLLGLGAAVALWWLLKALRSADPRMLATVIRNIGGASALGLAALLMMRGRLDMAIFVGGLGAWMLGWPTVRGPSWLGRSFRVPPWMSGDGASKPGAVSVVKSHYLSMRLDHDSGAIQGTVIDGPLAGRELDALDQGEIAALMRTCLAADPDGVSLLEAYLDRRTPGWREHADTDSNARQAGQARPSALTEQEAYEILGLQPGADDKAIRTAHRGLMKRLHPDAGGSAALAARVNEAKDILLKRHR